MIVRSPFEPVSIPDVPLTRFLLERCEARGDKPAFVDGPTGRTLTHAGWGRDTRRAAKALARRGLGKGDVLAIYSPNLPEYAVAFHAAALLGGVVTTVNPLYTADELAFQLSDSRARFLVTVPPLLDKAREAARRSGVGELFVFGEAEGATPFAALLEEDGEPPAVAIDPANDVLCLPYSSGTTGLPKGVMLTHRNILANVLQTERALVQLGEAEVLAGVLPFFHSYGLVVVLNGVLNRGQTAITVPRFELEAFLGLVQKHAITFANLVPPIILALAKHPVVDRYDLSSLRHICSGAAPLSEGVARACAERLGCSVFQGYGLTETSPVSHLSAPDTKKPASIGQPIPNTEAKVADLATGAALPAGQEGEICLRGPQLMRGYLGRPEATAAMIDAEGWLHSGDVGYADADGDFFVVDRVKELIKYKGLQVAPAELEAVLLSHPAVADAAVVPVPDEEAGELPKAFVVLKGEATAEALLAFVAERVAPYKKIRSLETIDQIPKTPSGKILRRVLVERERAKSAGQ